MKINFNYYVYGRAALECTWMFAYVGSNPASANWGRVLFVSSGKFETLFTSPSLLGFDDKMEIREINKKLDKFIDEQIEVFSRPETEINKAMVFYLKGIRHLIKEKFA